MKQFEITISYSKIVDSVDEAAAQTIIDQIKNHSNLDDEYGPFSILDVYTEVEEVSDDQ